MSGESFFVTYEKQKFNISSFLLKHPGGSEILQEYRDKDITTAYDEINHSEEAKEIMKRYLVVEENQSTNASETNKDANTTPIKRERRPNDLKSQLKHAYEKLVTKEDKNFLHKFFGFTCLALFTYRYSYFFKNGTLGFDGQLVDYLTLLCHFLLSFSSLIFHVLEKRLESNPLIIYEEYRLHAIVFSGRAVGVSLFGMSTYISSLSPMVRQALLIAFILTIHLVVDFITYKYGTQGVTAVRVNNKDKSLRGLKLFFAYYQFMALASHLVLDEKLNDLGYNTLIAIQSSAFLMTLKRKGIIRWYSHLFWYSLALFFSISYMLYVKGLVFFAFVSFFFYLRVELNLSKYLVWTYYLFGYFFFDFYQFRDQISSDFLFNFLK